MFAGLLRKAAALAMALLLMASFYLYALMREDEGTKMSEQWVVDSEAAGIAASGGLVSADAKALAAAFGSALPLPGKLSGGEITDGSYHGYYVRRLEATDGVSTVSGVSPASASPLLRGGSLSWASTEKTLMGFPLLSAQDAAYAYYYLAADRSAFVLRLPVSGHEELLRRFIISQP